MRLVVATCSVDYAGRLSAHLPEATRLLVLKADGTILIHADSGSKALNWMASPCRLVEGPRGWTATSARGERLDISITAVHSDVTTPLGEEPGLTKTHSEAEIQRLLAASCDCIEAGLRLVRREHPTPIGPVDLLCLDDQGSAVAVEVKRVGDIDGVEQLSRYLRYLERDTSLQSVRGVYVAGTVKPQARTLAQDRGIRWVEVDFDVLAERREPELTLFDGSASALPLPRGTSFLPEAPGQDGGMERDASAANPPEDRGDSVNPNPGDGASGPGELAYDSDSQVGDVGGEAAIDLEDRARRMAEGDTSSDPALAAATDASLSPNEDEVSENPEVQAGG